MSAQDQSFREHFFALAAGAAGQDAAKELRRIFARAQRRGEAGSFVGFVTALMIQYDAEAVVPYEHRCALCGRKFYSPDPKDRDCGAHGQEQEYPPADFSRPAVDTDTHEDRRW